MFEPSFRMRTIWSSKVSYYIDGVNFSSQKSAACKGKLYHTHTSNGLMVGEMSGILSASWRGPVFPKWLES